jgi:hypothetical protein
VSSNSAQSTFAPPENSLVRCEENWKRNWRTAAAAAVAELLRIFKWRSINLLVVKETGRETGEQQQHYAHLHMGVAEHPLLTSLASLAREWLQVVLGVGIGLPLPGPPYEVKIDSKHSTFKIQHSML